MVRTPESAGHHQHAIEGLGAGCCKWSCPRLSLADRSAGTIQQGMNGGPSWQAVSGDSCLTVDRAVHRKVFCFLGIFPTRFFAIFAMGLDRGSRGR
jgi:hypothetical protein